MFVEAVSHLLLLAQLYRLWNPCTHLTEASTLYEQFSLSIFPEIVQCVTFTTATKNIQQVAKMLYLAGSGATVHTKWEIRVTTRLLTPLRMRHLLFRMDAIARFEYLESGVEYPKLIPRCFTRSSHSRVRALLLLCVGNACFQFGKVSFFLLLLCYFSFFISFKQLFVVAYFQYTVWNVHLRTAIEVAWVPLNVVSPPKWFWI